MPAWQLLRSALANSTIKIAFFAAARAFTCVERDPPAGI